MSTGNLILPVLFLKVILQWNYVIMLARSESVNAIRQIKLWN